MHPMLAQPIAMDQMVKYCNDDEWWEQGKLDGQRALFEINNGHVEVFNRSGAPKSSMLTHKILAAFEDFSEGEWMFDGEIVDGRLHIFDMPKGTVGDVSLDPTMPYSVRYSVLQQVFAAWNPGPSIVLVDTAKTTTEKIAMITEAQEKFAEGVMFKHSEAPYESGRRSTMLKLKFVKEADCFIYRIGDEGKANAVLALLDPVNGKIVELNPASIIGKSPTPKPGQVWEVRFLYCVDPSRPRLVQPRLMRCRDGEKDISECLIDQLDHCYTNKQAFNEKTRSEM